MILGDPDMLYQCFTDHVKSCLMCRGKGPHCVTGRQLVMDWGRAYDAYVGIEVTRQHEEEDRRKW